MLKKIPPIIDFSCFSNYNIVYQNNNTQIIKCNNKNSPYREHIFKTFQLPNQSSKDQKVILETFNQINSQKSQYLLSYSRFSFFSFQSIFHPTFSRKYFASRTLESLFKEQNFNTKWNLNDVMNCLFAVSQGLSLLHSHLSYHGNLCPSNIIVDTENQCYLCDFGLYPIKKLYYNSNDLFNNDYKDPILNDQEPSFENDVYSFGILMCQFCLTFFKTENYITLNDYIKNFDKKRLSFLPPLFLDLIPKCLFLPFYERPSIKQILEMFENSSYKIDIRTISGLYNEFMKKLYIEQRAKSNDPFALYKLGVMYENGKGVPKDRKKAISLYKKSASLGNSKAQNNIGVLLQEETSEELIRRGARYLKLSAEQGNINGMANYGVALNDGIGTDKNEKVAREYLKRSADLGFPYAQVNYGFAIVNDKDPSPEQIKEGLHYIKLSMSQNYPDAFYTYGILLYYGKVVEENKKLAMFYFKTAADMGHILGMNDYAQGYYIGDGVEVNKEIALEYYQKAADLGNETAKEMVEKIKNEESSKPTLTKKSSGSKSSSESIQNSPSKKSSGSKSSTESIQNNPSKKSSKSKSSSELSNSNNNESNAPLQKSPSKKSVSSNPKKKATTNSEGQGNKKKRGRKPAHDNSIQTLESIFDVHSHQKSPDEPKIIPTENINLMSPLNKSSISKLWETSSTDSESPPDFMKNDDKPIKKTEPTKNKVFSLLSLQEEDDDSSNNDDSSSSSSSNTEEASQNEINPSVLEQMSAKQLMKLGDKMTKNNNHQKAIEYYEAAARKGCPSAYLKCTEICEQFETKLDYYELAIRNNVEGAFSQWRKSILKHIAFQKDPNVLIQLAKRFEKFNDFSDAASIYRKAKDKNNFAICYEKAKENIDSIQDGMHQFHFAKLLEGQNDNDLALIMYKKAFQNGITQAEQKIKEFENKNQ